MNRKQRLVIMMFLAGCLIAPKSFAQDYQQRNIFNHLTDWSVTLGKSPEEKQRIIDQRVDRRAKARESRDQKNFQGDKIQNQRDQESKDYENRKADVQKQYRNDPDTMNKKMQDVENDHQSKMNDLDNQWKANEAGHP